MRQNFEYAFLKKARAAIALSNHRDYEEISQHTLPPTQNTNNAVGGRNT